MRFVLVHSPLVGPAAWRWVAEALRSSGHEVFVPDLTGGAATGDPRAVIDQARRSIPPGTCVVVGHSGAGSLLPSIAVGPDADARRLVFVDAGVPPCAGEGDGECRLPRSPAGARRRRCPPEVVDLVGRGRDGTTDR